MAKFWLLAVAVVGLTAGPAVAETLTPVVAGGDQFFTVSFDAPKSGTPMVRGHVTNDSGFPATNIRLLVDSLDGSGNVINQTIAFMSGQIAPGQHADFDVRVPGQATNYRISVFQFEFLQGAGGDASSSD